MSEIRRGAAAIQEVVDSKGEGGPFRKWIPSIFWPEADEERYLLILNEMDAIPTFEMIGFIKTEQGFTQEAVAKTDPYLGESTDAFVKEWSAKPRQTSLAVAVELEPVIELVNGRKKPRGFRVKTVEYERTVLDDDGEATDEKIDVTAPAIGVISQSPYNFFNQVASFDATEAPIHLTPVKIKRIGSGTKTTYSVTGYEDQEVDLDNLLEYWEGINYLSDDIESIEGELANLEPLEFAQFIGTTVLDKRMEELLDDDRYDELFEGVTESMAYKGGKTKKDNKNKAKAKPSQRKAKALKETESDESEDQPKAKEKTSSKTRMDELKARAAAKAAKSAT
jgi:hypothetical protein